MEVFGFILLFLLFVAVLSWRLDRRRGLRPARASDGSWSGVFVSGDGGSGTDCGSSDSGGGSDGGGGGGE